MKDVLEFEQTVVGAIAEAHVRGVVGGDEDEDSLAVVCGFLVSVKGEDFVLLLSIVFMEERSRRGKSL